MRKHRIFENAEILAPYWQKTRSKSRTVVFTNGCFDILHAGHVAYLEEAKALGDFLVLGLNSDTSVRRLKGPKRPLNLFEDRAKVLAGLASVNLVVGFDEETPLRLIRQLGPDILVKGGDWDISQIVGADFVLERGGQVRSLPFHSGRSTTGLVDRILERYGQPGP